MRRPQEPLLRIDAEATKKTFMREMLFAFSHAKLELSFPNANELWASLSSTSNRSRVVWDDGLGLVFAFILTADNTTPRLAASIRPVQPPHPNDLKLANAYIRVFVEDLKAAPDLKRHQELWETLSISRAPRAIARLSAFSTTPFLSCLTTMEAAAHLKYEGESFQSVVLMSKQAEWISKPAADGYIVLKPALNFSQALLEEKWIRALVKSRNVALHSLGHGHGIVGIVSLSQTLDPQTTEVLLPTHLREATSMLRNGTMAFVSAANGDLYVVLPSGAVFVKTQGRWHYLNFASFQSLIAKYVPENIVLPLLQVILDMSFERRGALFCIPDLDTSIQELVPDHHSEDRPNRALRRAAKNLSINSDAHRAILLATASIDGSIIVSQNGTILDVACMIGEPDEKALAPLGMLRLQRLPGARSTAAWNASILGISIQISEDGPISVYSKGILLGRLG